MTMLETINLVKQFGDQVALNNVSLVLEEGSTFALLGSAGSGKSTFVRILSTQLKPTWGEVRIDGSVLGYQNPLIRRIIGYVPSYVPRFGDVSVGEYVEFFAACHNVPDHGRAEIVSWALELARVAYLSEHRISRLSTHERRRLELARAIVHRPRFLFLDDPMSSADSGARQEMCAALCAVKDAGFATILMTQHRLYEAAEICESVGVLESGELLWCMSSDEILERAGLDRAVEVACKGRPVIIEKILGDLPLRNWSIVQGVGDQTTRVECIIKADLIPGGSASEIVRRLHSEVDIRAVSAGWGLLDAAVCVINRRHEVLARAGWDDNPLRIATQSTHTQDPDTRLRKGVPRPRVRTSVTQVEGAPVGQRCKSCGFMYGLVMTEEGAAYCNHCGHKAEDAGSLQ